MYNFRVLGNYLFCDMEPVGDELNPVAEGLRKNVEIRLVNHTANPQVSVNGLNNWSPLLYVPLSNITVEGVSMNLADFLTWSTTNTGNFNSPNGGSGATSAANLTVTPTVNSLNNAQAVLENHETRIDTLEGSSPSTGTTVDYVNVYRTSDIAVTGQSAIRFNTVLSGNIPYNTSNGQFTLTAGKTYKLTGNVNVNQANASLFTAWYNVTSAAYISPGGRATSADSATAGYGTNQGEIIFTPTVTTIVELRNNLGSTVAVAGAAIGSLNGVASQATIVQLGSTSNTVGTLPAVDQSAAGYFDIGNMRMQWGIATGGSGSIVTLPASFANANYSLSGIVPNNTTALFSGITITATTFTVNLWNTNGGGVAGGTVRWIAIGQRV